MTKRGEDSRAKTSQKKRAEFPPSGITKKGHHALEHLSHDVANIRRYVPTLYWQAVVAQESVKARKAGPLTGPSVNSVRKASCNKRRRDRPDQTRPTRPTPKPPPQERTDTVLASALLEHKNLALPDSTKRRQTKNVCVLF